MNADGAFPTTQPGPETGGAAQETVLSCKSPEKQLLVYKQVCFQGAKHRAGRNSIWWRTVDQTGKSDEPPDASFISNITKLVIKDYRNVIYVVLMLLLANKTLSIHFLLVSVQIKSRQRIKSFTVEKDPFLKPLKRTNIERTTVLITTIIIIIFNVQLALLYPFASQINPVRKCK